MMEIGCQAYGLIHYVFYKKMETDIEDHIECFFDVVDTKTKNVGKADFPIAKENVPEFLHMMRVVIT